VLLKADAEVGTIIASTSIGVGGKGTYTWPIGSSPTLTTGSDMKVMVQSINQPTIKDASNNVFTLTPAGTTPASSITVTSPNGGETWQRGTTHTVTWDYSGNPSSPGAWVKIVLLNAGAEAGTIIGSTSIGGGGKGTYTWPIGSSGLTGSDFKVKVQSISDPTISDTSNNVFTLTPAGTTTPSGVATKSDQWVAHNTLVPLPPGFTVDQCDIIVSQYHFVCPEDAFLNSFTSGYTRVVGGQIRIQASGYCKNSNSQLTQITGYSNYLIICHS
jgi:hypothetical protein